MPGKPSQAGSLRNVAAGDKILASDQNALRDVAARSIDIPDAIQDSTGIRVARSRRRGGGGGATGIWFRVLSSGPLYDEPDMVCGVARVQVTDVSCNSSGVSVGDEKYVFDPTLAWLALPEDQMIGADGKATEVDGSQGSAIGQCIDAYDLEVGGCWFRIDWLCCTGQIWYE